jgi:hypothetical protein
MWESYRAKHNLTTTAPFASVVFFDQIMAEPNKTYTVKQNFQMGERLSAASSHCFCAVRHAVPCAYTARVTAKQRSPDAVPPEKAQSSSVNVSANSLEYNQPSP